MADQWKQEPFVPFEMPKPPPGACGSPEANAAGLLGFALGYGAVKGAWESHRQELPPGEQPQHQHNFVDSFFEGLAGLGFGFLMLIAVVFILGVIF